MRNILQKTRPIIIAIVILFVFFLVPLYFLENEVIKRFYPTITAIGGFLFSLPIKMVWHDYTKPVLEIMKTIEQRSIQLENFGNKQYAAHRIIVRNIGKTAAKNCKGYVIANGIKERVCWSIPKDRAVIKINAEDEERLDVCSLQNDTGMRPKIIVPTEEGLWDPRRYVDETESRFTVLVTAENTEPVSAALKINLSSLNLEYI